MDKWRRNWEKRIDPRINIKFVNACKSAQLEIIKKFFEYYNDYNDTYFKLREGISAAINAGHTEVAIYLLEKWKSKNYDKNLWYVMMIDVCKNTTFPKSAYQITKYLLKQHNYNLSYLLYAGQNLSIIYLFMRMGARDYQIPMNIGHHLLINRHLLKPIKRENQVFYFYKREPECTTLYNIIRILGGYDDVIKFYMRFVGFNSRHMKHYYLRVI